MKWEAEAARARLHQHRLKLVAAWSLRYQMEIRSERGPIVATACRQEVERLVGLRGSRDAAPVILMPDQIQRVEDAVVSQARMLAYGPYSLRRNDEGASWRDEMATTRALIRDGKRPLAIAAIDQPPPETRETRERLADLARAHREGKLRDEGTA